MKIPLLFTVVLFGMIACTSVKTKMYAINGSVDDSTLNSKKAYLTDYGSDDTIDSCVIENGKFSFKGEIGGLTVLRIDADHLYANLLADEGAIEVKLNSSSDDPYVQSGTSLNDKMRAYERERLKVYEDYSKKKENVIDREILDSLKNEWSEVLDVIKEKYFKENKNNALGVYLAWEKLLRNFSVGQVDSILNFLPEANRSFGVFRRWREAAVNKELTCVGKMFLDFDGVNADSVAIKLSDYVGKGNYVLIDFWASWCGPCIGEIPVIREIYETYKDKGLVVIGINVWDDKKSFDEVRAELNMPWDQICVYDSEIPTDKYGVDGIPQIILFAPDGTITIRNLIGEEMKAKIAEVYAK